jgi:threonine synthase
VTLAARERSLWRYAELLPLLRRANVVSLGEGWSPLIPLSRLGAELGLGELLMKDEGVLPTGTFKARGAAVGVSKARELGVKEFGMPTNGNAGAAWALYAARAGMTAHIVMPTGAPAITRAECSVAGADVRLLRGLINDCGRVMADAVRERGWYDAGTLREPYRIEGKKTMGYELAEQLNWTLPDAIVYPAGGGVGLIGIYKALCEMRELGWIEGALPRLVAVQATGCAPLVDAFKRGARESVLVPGSKTMAFGINVPKALGDFLVLDAVYATAGCAVAVGEGEIVAAMRDLATREGCFVCPEGGAAYAGVKKLCAQGFLKAGERVTVLNTGAGIKYPDALSCEVPLWGAVGVFYSGLRR